jgi:hypothetical protein
VYGVGKGGRVLVDLFIPFSATKRESFYSIVVTFVKKERKKKERNIYFEQKCAYIIITMISLVQ